MLLALVSAHSASDLTLLHMDDPSADSWRFHLIFDAKQDKPGHLPRDNIRDIIITRYATLIGCILDSTKPEVLLHGRARCRFGGVHFPNTA